MKLRSVLYEAQLHDVTDGELINYWTHDKSSCGSMLDYGTWYRAGDIGWDLVYGVLKDTFFTCITIESAGASNYLHAGTGIGGTLSGTGGNFLKGTGAMIRVGEELGRWQPGMDDNEYPIIKKVQVIAKAMDDEMSKREFDTIRSVLDTIKKIYKLHIIDLEEV